MKILIDVAEQTIRATLHDNSAAAKDFYQLLPLELTLGDYAGIEKVSDLPSKLNTKGEPLGVAAQAGDLTYYAPWGNLAYFIKDFKFASGLVSLGQVHEGLELLNAAGDIPVTIRKAS
ncbi:cyclophilin-like fold protein [Marinomonas ostreistagni]|uniref:cyclophilin-like fold protein n=1 Tax=Marinomonas ostreistagni TaxID=359209 RepID=UPI0019517721|nr:cyclophilin-like fold protein [Marinomonas ostreistagni]MBM6550407.1 hypothetical protein [Marinomonas ostreistagni]